MSFEVDAIVIGEGSEAGSFEVLPGASEKSIALPSTVQAVSIFREEFAANEKVTIIENNGQYGIAKKAAGLKGCIIIPDISTSNIFLENPAQTASAYIGRMAGNYRTTYAVGTVKAIVGDKISVEYFDGTKTLGIAPVMALTAADFAVNDLVLVNLWEYNQHLVCGWWGGESLSDYLDYVATCANDAFGSGQSIVARTKSGKVLFTSGGNSTFDDLDYTSLAGIKKVVLHPYFFAALKNDGSVFFHSNWAGASSYANTISAWPKIVDIGAWNYNLAGVGENGLVYSTQGPSVDFGVKVKKVFTGGNGLFSSSETGFLSEENIGFIGILGNGYALSPNFPAGEVGTRYLEKANTSYITGVKGKIIYVYRDKTKETLVGTDIWGGENDISEVVKAKATGINGNPRAFLTQGGDVFWTNFSYPQIEKRYTDCVDCTVHQYNTNGYGIVLTVVKKDGSVRTTAASSDYYTKNWNLNS